MSFDLSHPNRYVFHFTRADILLQNILPERRLRLSPLGKTNDPRETQNRTFVISEGRSIDDDAWSDEMVELVTEANKLLQQKYKILCTTSNDPALCSNTAFGRGYSHARMWAQYSEKHKGSCIVLEKEALHKEICQKYRVENVYNGPVRYSDYSLQEDLKAFQLSYKSIQKYGLEKVLEEHTNKHFNAIFLRKNSDWKNECEFRWILKSKSNDYEYVSIVDALKAVFVSIDFPQQSLDTLKGYCESLRIHGGEIKWINGYPVLWPSRIFNPG